MSLCQGSVEQAFLNFLERDGDSIRVERNLTPSKLHIDEAQVEDHHAHPVEVHLRQLRNNELADSSSSTGVCGPQNGFPCPN